jgi:hypothetical protein
MSDRKLSKDEVERLLRQALADDLAPEVEEPLRAGLRPAWRRAAKGEAAARQAARPGALAFVRTGWALLPPRAVLGTAALLMLAAGVVTHLANPPRVLAESLSLRQAASATAFQLARAAAMECSVETHDADGRALRYRIEWRASQHTRVRITDADGVHLVPVERRDAESILDLGSPRTAAHSTSRPTEDPGLWAVGDFLSPRRVRALLAGAWEAVSGPAQPGTADFRSSTAGRPALRVTIDPRTHLPLRIEIPSTLSARCEWVPGALARSVLGGAGGPGTR